MNNTHLKHMNKEQAEAKKRSLLRRYLVLSGVVLDTADWDLKLLQALVKGLHQQSLRHGRPNVAWPMSLCILLVRVKQVPYVSQLVALKRCFGPNAAMGCVVEAGNTVFCRTVKDLIRIGWVSPRHAYLDRYLPILTPTCRL